MHIFVGMSGGVDSSVVAARLQQEGHDITGVFIKGWYPEGFPCTWREDRLDAMRVASKLGIPFTTLDLSQEYKTSVIDHLISEYQAGRTPNPDVLCNQDIKFGHFLTRARAAGADAVATGHYARTEQLSKYTQLLRGVDAAKDQSYFLYTLTQNELPYILFPLGKYTKNEVRTQAAQFDLPTAHKKDSQGLCFVGKLDMEEFLAPHLITKEGVVENLQGQVIGSHRGVQFFTLGQRHGFVLNADAPKEALYVCKKDVSRNVLVVGSREVYETNVPEQIYVQNISWTHLPAFKMSDLAFQYRYHGPVVAIQKIEAHGNGACIWPAKKLPERPAEGQAVVFYRGEECVGGGSIVYY